MRLSNALVPLGSFAVAVILGLVAGPSSGRIALRAADEPTGGTQVCAKWTIDNHVGEATKWWLKVKKMESTLTNTEPVFASEATLANLLVAVTYKNAAGVVQPPELRPYRVLVGITPKNWPAGSRKWNLAPQSVEQFGIKIQIGLQFADSVDGHDLLGNPIPGAPPAGSRLVRIDLLGGYTEFETQGYVLCKLSRRVGDFKGRPLIYYIDADGNGAGAN